jgi:pyruvate dehydrogenase E1 component alpha subunit
MTYRFLEHNEGLKNILGQYRDVQEESAWRARDPIELFARTMVDRGVPEADLETLRAEVEREVEEAVQFANESPWPEPEAAFADLYTEQPRRYAWPR